MICGPGAEIWPPKHRLFSQKMQKIHWFYRIRIRIKNFGSDMIHHSKFKNFAILGLLRTISNGSSWNFPGTSHFKFWKENTRDNRLRRLGDFCTDKLPDDAREGENFCTVVINEKYFDGAMKTRLSGEENCTLSTLKTTWQERESGAELRSWSWIFENFSAIKFVVETALPS